MSTRPHAGSSDYDQEAGCIVACPLCSGIRDTLYSQVSFNSPAHNFSKPPPPPPGLTKSIHQATLYNSPSPFKQVGSLYPLARLIFEISSSFQFLSLSRGIK